MKADSRLKIAVALAVAGATFGTTGWAADTATASVSANVAAAIAVTKTTDMVVGNFVPGASAGDVTLSTSGARTFNGVTSATGITPAAAKFSVTGCNSCTYSIAYTGSSANLSSGANTMAADWITAAVNDDTAPNKVDPDSDATSGTLSASGAGQIFAGVKLTVGAGQATGAYSGSLVVITQYN